MSAILKCDFQKKKKTITFFGRKLSQIHRKEIILHVTITFSLKKKGGNKKKQWTHFSTLKIPILFV